MSLVKVKTKSEVTLPSALRERAGLNVGDPLEATFEGGKITLTPKSLIDGRIEEGLEDIRRGRTYDPFDTPDQMIDSLQRNRKERAKPNKTKRPRLPL